MAYFTEFYQLFQLLTCCKFFPFLRQFQGKRAKDCTDNFIEKYFLPDLK